jgi:hypothetical protein
VAAEASVKTKIFERSNERQGDRKKEKPNTM